MKTSTLAILYSISGGVSFFVAKVCYLNGIVPHWYPLWLDMMGVVSLAAIAAGFYTNRRIRIDVNVEGKSLTTATKEEVISAIKDVVLRAGDKR